MKEEAMVVTTLNAEPKSAYLEAVPRRPALTSAKRRVKGLANVSEINEVAYLPYTALAPLNSSVI